MERRPLSLTAAIAFLALSACSNSAAAPAPQDIAPTTVTAVEGAGLEALPGTILPSGPTVEVRDHNGEIIAGTTVSFTVVDGGGTVLEATAETDSSGRAGTTWILGRAAGSDQHLMATAGDATIQFTARIVAPVLTRSYFGRADYIEYLPGNLPLVVSAPHGGDLMPDEIPDRTSGTTVRDRNTVDLALRVREAVHEATGGYPFVVVSHLHRIKLDPNREIEEAAEGDGEAERAWWEFQTFVSEARRAVEDTFGEGLYLDLHGHGHTIQRLELGYLLSADDLAQSDVLLAADGPVAKSSLRALGSKPGVDFAALVRGPMSLGTMFENAGIPAVPSRNQPDPGGNLYFTGGYNTATHGSRDGGMVSGVQIECNYTGVRDTETSRIAFGEALADILPAYFTAHFDIQFAPGN